MLKQIRKTIATYAMLGQGDHILVAVSGGPDSVALLRILLLLKDEFRLRLTTAHLNHGLRGREADEEEMFVRRLSDEMAIPCVCRKMDIHALARKRRGSLEDIGREERYRFFREAAEACGTEKIALGHHRDDQAETIMLHLLRGTGPEGLRGILPVREGRIIRPLLEVDRSDILRFLKREGAAYRVDGSNSQPLFLRNRIRNELLPELSAKYNPRLIRGLCQTAGIIRREDDYLRDVVDRAIRGLGIDPVCRELQFPVVEFLRFHEAIQARIIKGLLEGAVPSRNGIGYRHVEAVMALVRRPAVRRVSLDLPFGIRIERREGILRICKGEKRTAKGRDRGKPIRFEYPVIEIPATVYLKEIGQSIRLERISKPLLREMRQRPGVAFMDDEAVTMPLILRNMQPGDRVEPLGMAGTKKLKDYFIDRKIDAALRGRIPLLVDGSGAILWIAGERISQRVRVTRKTRTVLTASMVALGEPSETI